MLVVLMVVLSAGSALLNFHYARRFASPAGMPDSPRVRLFRIGGWGMLLGAVLMLLSLWFD